MNAATTRITTGTAQAGAPDGPSATAVPGTAPVTWSREAAGLRIPRHRAGAGGAHRWIHTGDLR